MIRAAVAFWLLVAGPVWAVDFSLPATAHLTVQRNTGPDVYYAPIGVFADGQVPTLTMEGDVARSAWRLEATGLTPFQVMRPLREQLIEAGFEIILDCAGDACGGFDFRFATETLPGPNMYVNIRAFHFVTATRQSGSDVSEVVSILASTAATSAYIQIIHAGEAGQGNLRVEADGAVPVNPDLQAEEGDLSAALLGRGHVVLSGVDFATGTTELAEGGMESLAKLAEFLKAQPLVRVALVGHTDNVGGLEGNIGISRDRARSVRNRLIERYGIDASRLDAEGMGYLAPVASNLDPVGREANRRVEAVLLQSP